MNLRLEMLQVARLAPNLLGDSAPLVEEFFKSEQNSDGGFKDRAAQSDLYYTVFGLDGLLALQVAVPGESVEKFLNQFGSGTQLDFVHLCCLARCWGTLKHATGIQCSSEVRDQLLARLKLHRSFDGGFNLLPQQQSGSVYAAFLAAGAFADLGSEISEPNKLVQSLKLLETSDGGWANDHHTKTGSTNATAAAVVLLTGLGMPLNTTVGDWLLARAHKSGGFVASPETPIPDLLSTATTLHALSCMQRDISGVREGCLDFVDSLWTNEGGFHGNWTDDKLDCEYTYYGLLALGHLSI
jgi:prenyltransferase beta subunit